MQAEIDCSSLQSPNRQITTSPNPPISQSPNRHITKSPDHQTAKFADQDTAEDSGRYIRISPLGFGVSHHPLSQNTRYCYPNAYIEISRIGGGGSDVFATQPPGKEWIDVDSGDGTVRVAPFGWWGRAIGASACGD